MAGRRSKVEPLRPVPTPQPHPTPAPCNPGLAVAERLGAPYPFADDPLATAQFDTYLKLCHGLFVRRRRQGRGQSQQPQPQPLKQPAAAA